MKGKKRNSLIVLGVVVSLVALLFAFGCQAAPPPAAPGTAEAELQAKITGLESKVAGLETDKKGLETKVKELEAPPEVYKWNLQCYHAPEACTFRGNLAFAERVNLLSEGRIEIECLPEGAILGPKEIHEGVGKGVVEMGYTGHTYFKGLEPSVVFPAGMPMAWRDVFDVKYTMDLGMLKETREAFALHNIYYLHPACSGRNTLWSKDPITSLADIDGYKIRAYGSFNVLFEAMGATTVFIPHSESYIGLATGTIEAYFTSPGNGVAYKHYEIAPYMHEPPLVTSTSYYSVNMDVWNSLPDDLQNVMQRCGEWAMYDGYDRYLTEYIEQVKTLFTIIQWDQEVIDKITELAPGIWQDEAKDARGERMLAILNDFMKARGYTK